MGSRRCTGCGHVGSERARFCEHCGSALVPGATPLRAPSTLETKILDERAGIEGERKQVTVMYADIVGSMDLTRSLEGERWGLVLDSFLGIAAGAVHQFEGTVNQFTGDGLLAVFGAPIAHEDHAQRACLAVLELQRVVAELAAEVAQRDGVEFAVRCGLNSGEVIVGAIGDDVHMDFVPVGNTTALGKRIEELAPAGSAAISASTAALVQGEFELRDLGESEVKGMDAPQRIWELLGRGIARTRLQAAAATRGLSQFVGRDTERAALESALESALAGGGHAVGIVGDPGVGKSRLVLEFVADCAARGLRVHATGGVAHGRYVPLLPLLVLLRDHFGIDESDAAEVARKRVGESLRALDPAYTTDLPLLFEFLGIPDPDLPLDLPDPVTRHRRLLEAVTRALTTRSRDEAAVLVLEDLHWVDDATDAFLDEFLEAVTATRLLVVATYRPEYDDAWAGERPHLRIGLGPLDADSTEDLLSGLLGRDASLVRLTAMIEARTAGNPFFVEEVVQTLVENGHLAGARGAYRLGSELDGLDLPPTVEAGLAARIDRLPHREKTLVQLMSVIGPEIPAPLLTAVAGLDERGLADAVALLARGQWVIPHEVSGRREYRFKHPLTQEVAYGSQLSHRRERAHGSVASAIERTYPESLDERAALLAHHSEAAGERLKAAGWHARAAAWAEKGSPADGMRHWRRVRHLTTQLEASRERDEYAAKARMGMISLGWRLGMSAEERADVHAEAQADAERMRLDLFYSGTLMHSGREREGLAGFRDVSHRAMVAGDPGFTLVAGTGVAYASWIAGSVVEGAAAMDQALPLVNGDPTAASGLAFICPLAHAFQSRGLCRGFAGELDQARQDFARGIELARDYDDPQTESAGLANLALLLASVEDYEAALSNAAKGFAVAERTGDVVHMIACSVPMALAEAATGRFADALARAEGDLAMARLQQIGLYFEPLLLATIARSRLALEEADAALLAAEEAVAIADARGLATCALIAPITLAQIIVATRSDAGDRVDSILTSALQTARTSRAQVFESQIQRQLATL